MITKKRTAQKGRGKGGVNKAAEIRAVLSEKGVDAAPKEVIATLAAKGVHVAPAQVSNIKATLRKKGPGGRRGAKTGASGDAVSLNALLDAKKLVDQLGSVDAVKRALSALERLR